VAKEGRTLRALPKFKRRKKKEREMNQTILKNAVWPEISLKGWKLGNPREVPLSEELPEGILVVQDQAFTSREWIH
jgi:hypothetical protein